MEKFISQEPECIAGDAFSIDWSQFSLSYAFPPFNLIGKVLCKCKQDKAQLIIIVPNWPTQHWFPLIADLKAEGSNLIQLPMTATTIGLPYDKNAVHPIWHRLNLLCFRLNGNQ